MYTCACKDKIHAGSVFIFSGPAGLSATSTYIGPLLIRRVDLSLKRSHGSVYRTQGQAGVLQADVLYTESILPIVAVGGNNKPILILQHGPVRVCACVCAPLMSVDTVQRRVHTELSCSSAHIWQTSSRTRINTHTHTFHSDTFMQTPFTAPTR